MSRINLKYNLQWLIDSFEKGKKLEYLFFWSHHVSGGGEITQSCFSQFWPSPFTVDGYIYNTAEHWMMAQKAFLFGDGESFQKIISAETPEKAKAMGRQVQPFNEEIWTLKRMGIVIRGNLHKFTQNKNLRQFLINTKDKILVEASPYDKIWGIGLKDDDERAKNPKCWEGLNLLGFALMEVRDFF